MILSDRSLREAYEFWEANRDRPDAPPQFLVHPFNPTQVQPASYDVTLGGQFRTFKVQDGYAIHPEDPTTFARIGHYNTWVSGDAFLIEPGQFVLAHTVESVCLGPEVQAQVCGKSSLGRLGLFVENAGFVDPGFRGQLTLELYNCCPRPIRLKVGMRIAQLSFHALDQPCETPYGAAGLGSHYQHQKGAVFSRGNTEQP